MNGHMQERYHLNYNINGIKNVKTDDMMYSQICRKKSLNPFVHELPLNTKWDNFKMIFMTLIVFPIRVFVIINMLWIGYVLAQIGLYGLSKDDLTSKPLLGWRRRIRWCLGFLGRMLMRCYAFHWVKIKGRLASRSEAPIIVVGPHSSFMDAIAIFWSNVPGLVNRIEDLQLPFFGKYITYSQPVSIKREDSKSRQISIMEIQKRATSKDDWSQLIIFPEGTCTNRSCLITFKPGAFYPGVPVQPLILRFPNKTDTITWTWDGPGAAKVIWSTLCQFHNYCELEYLPVYYPSKEEIADPFLYARNVRQVMAEALGVPVVDYTFEDCRIMHKAKLCKLPSETGLIEYLKLRKALGNMTVTEVEEELSHYSKIARTKGMISLFDLSLYLGIPHTEPSLIALFNLFDKEGYGVITFRDYLINQYAIKKEVSSEETMNLVFKIMDEAGKGKIYTESFINTLNLSLGITEAAATNIFHEIDRNLKGYITSDDFKEYFVQRPEYLKLLLICQNDSKNRIHISYFSNGVHKKCVRE